MEEVKTNNNIQEKDKETETNNTNEVKSWRDIVITPEMPVGLVLDFINVLNQRLADIEDILINNKQNTTND